MEGIYNVRRRQRFLPSSGSHLCTYSQKWNCAASLFPKQNYSIMFWLPSPNSYTHISVRDCCSQIHMWTDPGNKLIALRHITVETGTEAAQFPEKEYVKGFSLQCRVNSNTFTMGGHPYARVDFIPQPGGLPSLSTAKIAWTMEEHGATVSM